MKSQKHETNMLSFFGMMVIISFVCGSTKGLLREHRRNHYCSRCHSNTAQNNRFCPKRMQSKAETEQTQPVPWSITRNQWGVPVSAKGSGDNTH